MLPITIENHGKELYSLLPMESRPDMHQVNFRWRNQRQLRKNVCRARAAGVKKSARFSMAKWS